MKKIFLIIILAVGVSLGVLAQGTVSFQNFSSATAKVYGYASVFSGQIVPAPAGYTVALLAGTVGTPSGGLTVVTTYVNNTTGGGQFFDNTTVVTPGPAGNGTADPTQNVELAVQAWTGNFANYSAAVAGGAIVAETAEFTNPTGGTGTSLPAALIGWVSGNDLYLTVPEPSTIGLTGIGLVVLWLFRRWKKLRLKNA